MSSPADIIPVVLFAYARPAHLRRVLDCLARERVPLLYAFADGAKGDADRAAVAEVRRLLRGYDAGELRLIERPANLGLGRNVLAGVGEVARAHPAFIVWEDDLVCVPGTYAWLCAALRHYADDRRVMSVTGWTHPSIRPENVGERPYFDGRAECWVWGSYARAWDGMERSAREKILQLRTRGEPADRYGADLPAMAAVEERRNIWAVRWLYHHLESKGLCLRPPWSLVEHIGFDELATNSAHARRWENPPLAAAPAIPVEWPAPEEHPECERLWRVAHPAQPLGRRVLAGARPVFAAGNRIARTMLRTLVPNALRQRLRPLWSWRWFRGDYPDWTAAERASGGYAAEAILQRVLQATLAVRDGHAAFERDGVLFASPDPDGTFLAALAQVQGTRTGVLRVLDFGGSLGSTYWRHRAYWPSDLEINWDVVEQPGFVAAGQQHLTSAQLQFFPDVSAAEAARPHDVLLCSGVLQYLPDPRGMLAQWRELNVPYLLLYNLPLHERSPDRLRVQHVPPSIYPASYPVWFFNRANFLALLRPYYDLVQEVASEAVWPVDFGMYPSTGLLLRRKPAAVPAPPRPAVLP